MLHNESTRVAIRSKGLTRSGSLRLVLALAALAVLPAIVLAGPIPSLPPAPGQSQPQPQPQPSPDPQPQNPAPGTDDSTYGGQQPQPAPAQIPQTQPYAYSGPIGRVRLGG